MVILVLFVVFTEDGYGRPMPSTLQIIFDIYNDLFYNDANNTDTAASMHRVPQENVRIRLFPY